MSSAFHYLADLVREHGLTLLIGTTVLLAMFSLLVRYSRSPSTKNLLASTAMLAVLGYLIVAIVPMPRFGIDFGGPDFGGPAPTSTDAPTTESPRIAASQRIRAAQQQPSSDQPAAASTAAAPIAPAMPPRTERLAAALPPPEPSPPKSNAFDPSPWIAGALALGALVFAAHLLLGWLRLRHLLKKSRSAPTELTGLVELPARTSLRIVNARVQPFCCGLLRPTIVLPRKLAQPTDETRFILLHERAHLTSGDTRARLLAALLRPLLFWHPLYWWLQRQLRFTSELLADDAAAQGSVAEYVRCMMTLSTQPDPATGGALVATIFRRRSELFRRLEMMLQRDEAISRSHSPLSRFARAASTLLLIALCAGTFGVERAVAQSPGNERVHTQVRALKAELDRLRQEILALRDAEKSTPQPKLVYGRLDPETGRVLVDPAAGELPRRNLFGNRIAPAADPVNRNRQEPGAGSAPRASGNRRLLYRVQKGDTLAKIAQKLLGSSRRTDEILRSNPTVQPKRLRVGQKLIIPMSSPHGGFVPRVNVGHRLPSTEAKNPLVASPAPRAPRNSRRAPTPPGPGAPRGRRGADPGTTAPSASGSAGAGAGLSAPGLSTPGAGPRRRGPAGPSYPSPRGRAAGATPSQPATAQIPLLGDLPVIGRLFQGGDAGGGSTTATSGLARNPLATSNNRSAASTSLSSLADLVTRYIELRGDVEIQEVNVRHAQSEKEAEIAKIRLRTKKSQFQAIQGMLNQELRAAEQAHTYSKKLHEKGFTTAAEVQATESKIVLLSRALR